MGIQEIIGDKRDAILVLAARYGASSVRIFGAVAEGEAKEDRDVDFLVDLVTQPALRWYIREKVMHQARPL